MDLTIHLTPDEEKRVQNARANGVDVENKLREVIDALEISDSQASGHLNGGSGKFRTSTARLLQSWIDEGDEEEQRETFDALREGLNNNHSSSRRIYP